MFVRTSFHCDSVDDGLHKNRRARFFHLPLPRLELRLRRERKTLVPVLAATRQLPFGRIFTHGDSGDDGFHEARRAFFRDLLLLRFELRLRRERKTRVPDFFADFHFPFGGVIVGDFRDDALDVGARLSFGELGRRFVREAEIKQVELTFFDGVFEKREDLPVGSVHRPRAFPVLERGGDVRALHGNAGLDILMDSFARASASRDERERGEREQGERFYG